MAADQDRFSEKLVRAITRAGFAREVRPLSEHFAVEVDGFRVNLHNAFEEYQRAGFFAKGKVVERWVEAVRQIKASSFPDTFDDARAHLLPYVRDITFFEHIKLMSTEGVARAQAFECLGGDLTLSVALDGEMTIQTVTEEQLGKWKVSLADALKVARANLRARTPAGLAQVSPGLFLSPYRDNYDAGRIVLTEVISRLPLNGDPVAFAPHRDSLIITGSEDTDNLVEAARMSLELLKDSRRISGAAVVFRSGQWRDFVPAADSAAHEPLRRARMMTLANNYAEQQTELQKLEGQDRFVGSFHIMEPAGSNRWCSYAVWSEGVPTWLPVADQVFFVSDRFGDHDPRLGPFAWEVVAEVAGGLLAPKDIRPARFFAADFPSEEMLTDMAKNSARE